MEKKNPKNLFMVFIFVAILVVFDQFTKYLSVLCLKGKEAFVLIEGVFEFRYLENRSAAFGIDLFSWMQEIFHFSYFESHPEAFLTCKMAFFVILTLLVVCFLFHIYIKIPAVRRYRCLDFIVMVFCAGAIGNCIDRLLHRYVIDFLYFRLIDFPIFNVADIYVTVSAFTLIALGLFYYKEADFEAIFPEKSPKRKEKDNHADGTV